MRVGWGRTLLGRMPVYWSRTQTAGFSNVVRMFIRHGGGSKQNDRGLGPRQVGGILPCATSRVGVKQLYWLVGVHLTLLTRVARVVGTSVCTTTVQRTCASTCRNVCVTLGLLVLLVSRKKVVVPAWPTVRRSLWALTRSRAPLLSVAHVLLLRTCGFWYTD